MSAAPSPSERYEAAPSRARALAPVVGVLVLAGASAIFANALYLKVLTSVAIFTLTSASIALLYRRLGLVSLAHVALMGCGGWVALRLAHGLHAPFELNVAAGGVFAAVVGMALAYPALRMRGLYLALVTLMAAGGFSVLITVVQFPNGAGGLLGFAVQAVAYMPRPWLAQSDVAYFVYCAGAAALGMFVIVLHERGRPGRAWALIRRSEASAVAAGVNVTMMKIWAFALSGFLAGIAGGLLAGNLQLLDTHSFPAGESVLIFALTIVGGARHWFGAVLAAILYRFAPALLNDWGVSGNAAYIFFGAALIHALSSAPDGIAGQVSDGLDALLGKGARRG